MTEATHRAEKIIIKYALSEAKNALLDYIEALEKQGGSMNYGRSVIMKIDHALEQVEGL